MKPNSDATSDAIAKVLDDLYRPKVSLVNASEALGFLASAHLDDGESLDWDLKYSLFHYSQVMGRAAADLAEIRRTITKGHGLALLEERKETLRERYGIPASKLSASTRDAWGKAASTTREDRDHALIERHAKEALRYVSGSAMHAVDTQLYQAQQALSRIAHQAPPSASLTAALHALPRVLRPHDGFTPIHSSGGFEPMGTCVNTFMDLHTFYPELGWTPADKRGVEWGPVSVPPWRESSAVLQPPPISRRSASRMPSPQRRMPRVAGHNRSNT